MKRPTTGGTTPSRPRDTGRAPVEYLCTTLLRAGLERTRFGEVLDRCDLCVVLGDALGCQMWIVEARSHDDGDTLDCSGFHVVDAVRLRNNYRLPARRSLARQPPPACWLPTASAKQRHPGCGQRPTHCPSRPGASSCTRMAKWCSRESRALHLLLQ